MGKQIKAALCLEAALFWGVALACMMKTRCMPPFSSAVTLPKALTRDSFGHGTYRAHRSRRKIGCYSNPHNSLAICLPIVSIEKEHTTGPCSVQPGTRLAGWCCQYLEDWVTDPPLDTVRIGVLDRRRWCLTVV